MKKFLKKPLTTVEICDNIYLPLKRGFICVEKKTLNYYVKISAAFELPMLLYRKGEKDES